MREREPVTQTMKASEARAEWSRILNRVFRKEARVLVEKNGVPVAAIVSAEDLKRLKRLAAEREARFQVLDEIGAAFADESPEEAEHQVELALSKVRARHPKRAPQSP